MTYKKKPSIEYALYMGDKFIDIGTKEELAEILGVEDKTIQFYSTPTYRKRYKNGVVVVNLGRYMEDEREITNV